MRKTIQELEALSPKDQTAYWADSTPEERMAAGWAMTKALYAKLGLYAGGQPMVRTARKMTREEWIIAEETDRV